MTKPDGMTKWAGRSMIIISLVHMLVLGVDALPQLSGWLRLRLWTLEHWRPASEIGVDLLLSQQAFWSTVGSFAIPLMVMGALLSWMAARGQRVPAFVGWALAAWVLVCTFIMEPSGFPLGFIPAGLLIAASRTRADA